MTRAGAVGIFVLAVAAGSLVEAAAALELQPVLVALDSPVYVTHGRDGTNRLFIVEQTGRIKVLRPGAAAPTVFLDLTAPVLAGGEQGLLGLAFHPRFAQNRRFFVNYTRKPDGATVVSEFHASSGNPDVADPGERQLLVIPQPFANHNGGMIEFGADGLLYIGMGDGGSGNDPGNRAQNLDDLLGKMLRLDVDGGTPYGIPAGNPFVGATPGRDEIFAVGFRNPFRFSFDRATGALLVGDVGQNALEEIDLVTVGGNYGWRVFEGTQCTGLDAALCTTLVAVAPITEYAHAAGRCSVIGGYIYRGARATVPAGAYVYGDFCTGEVLRLLPASNVGMQTTLLDTSVRLSSFGEDEAGELYVVGLGGTVDRLSPSPLPPPCQFTATPTSQSFPAGGGLGQVTVTTSSDCGWLAASHVDWLVVTAGTTGAGNGTITVMTLPSSELSSRTGSLSVGGQTVTVTQEAPTVPSSSSGGCFIATAAYGSPMAQEIETLRAFRGRWLRTSAGGRLLLDAYERASPPLARLIAGREWLRRATRAGLRPVVWWAGLAVASPSWAGVVLGAGVAVTVFSFAAAARIGRRGKGQRRLTGIRRSC